MKTAIVVLSDPKGGDEALGRVFNALAAAYDLQQRHDEVNVVFQGAGTRWPAVLQRADHPVHGLYEAVKDTIAGVSTACALLFGAEEHGLPLLADNPVPGTSGVPSLARYAADGWAVITF